MNIITTYFPNLSESQINQFKQLEQLYKDWNSKINVISRKDIDELYLRHVLHALGIAKVIGFKSGTKVLDVGTGGGFPGVPLAIVFPDSSFHLVDSINKKLKVVSDVAESIGLKNVKTTHVRAENIKGKYDFIVSRAVTSMPEFVSWVEDKVAKKHHKNIKNGILYLKGGDLTQELKNFPKAKIYELKNYFNEDFFETKKVVYLEIS